MRTSRCLRRTTPKTRPRRSARQFRSLILLVVAAALVIGPLAKMTAASHGRRKPAPDLRHAHLTRVLVLGDSVAQTFGLALDIDARVHGVVEEDDGILGCGVAVQQAVWSQGQVETMGPACNSSTPVSGQWPALWRRWIDQFRPDTVVVLAGRWETQDALLGFGWTSILQPSYAAYIESQLAEAVDVASSDGAHVDLLTSPCFDGGAQPDGQPWPESNPARVGAFNRLVNDVASAHARSTTVVNLDAVICPGGHFRMNLDGVQIRDQDGIHFPGQYAAIGAFGHWIGPKIWPTLLDPREVNVGPRTISPVVSVKRPASRTSHPAGR